jgi:hypothetical protein
MKENLNPQEWVAVRNTPHIVVLATAQAGSSGFFGTIGEMMTAGKAVFDATTHANELIREIAGQDEVKAAQASIRAEIEQGDPADVRAWIRAEATAKVKQSMTILRMRAPEQCEPYAAWLKSLAQRVAESSKEGGFLGFGGERVSEGERVFLAELDAAIGS